MATVEELDESVRTARVAGCNDLVLLKCTSTYPATPGNSNLLTIPYMRELFNCEVGLSDHTMGIGTAVAAVARGASVIEKHFALDRSDGGVDSSFSLAQRGIEKHVTFDRSLPGPDHPFAMTMEEFAEMVRQGRQIEEVLGTGEKVPADSENSKQHRMRRGVYNPVTLEPLEGEDGIWLRPQHLLTRTIKS